MLLYNGFHKIDEVSHPKFDYKFEKVVFPNAVGAILLTEDNYMPLVSQFRPAAGVQTLEIPAGLCDKKGLSEEEIMKEELQEELGLSREMTEKIKVIEGSKLKSYMLIGSTDATITLIGYKIPYTLKELIEIEENISPLEGDDVDEVVWVNFEDVLKNNKLLSNKEMKAYDMKTILFAKHLSEVLDN